MNEIASPFRRNPAWTREEIILVAAVVATNGWRELRAPDSDTGELSFLLRALDIHPAETRGSDFRSPGSVSRKAADIVTAHSAYSGTPTRGGTLTREIVQETEMDPGGTAVLAEEIRARALAKGLLSGARDVIDPDLGVPVAEGRLHERKHLARERDSGVRNAKVNAVLATGGRAACEVCEFDFEDVYGGRGRGFIEVHHRVPLHVSGATETSISDLALLCSNCHRMIHRHQPWLTVEELQSLVTGRRGVN